MKRQLLLLPSLLLLIPAFLFTGAFDDETVAKKKAADDYRASIVSTEISSPDQLGWTGKENSCKPGKLSYSTYVKMITRINYFRRLAGLPDNVVLDSTWNKYAQAAALISFANGENNHTPTPATKCYSNDGKIGCGSSNLSTFSGLAIIGIVSSQVEDGGDKNKDCGHRRWLLYSQAYKMGAGATPGSCAIRVFAPYDEKPKDTSSFHGKVPEYFGYPFQGYVPFQVLYPKWSFSVPGRADFKSATVEVKTGTSAVTATIISRSEMNYGDPTLIWKVAGLKENNSYMYDMSEKKKDVETIGLLNKKVTVKISNVRVDGKLKSYTYSFTIFDPDEVK